MIKLLFYIGILILFCYILDYFYLKSKEKILEAGRAYKEMKDAENNLHNLLKDKRLEK